MRLVRGGPGSGKSELVLREFKEALRQGETAPRIVVPTATLVRHFRHELARDGVVFPPSGVVSLNRFARDRAPDLAPVPEGLLAAIVRDALTRVKVPEFAEAASTEGMVATVTETIGLFENANCTPDKLAAVRKLPPLAKAFERIWRVVDEAIGACGYYSRASILRAAAANPEPARIWMDGFLTFSPLEIEFLRGLARSCDLTLTLDESSPAREIYRLALAMGAKDQQRPAAARKPRNTIVPAGTPEREADEIARRIVELNSQGTPFRRIGIALRDSNTYVPLLRTTFDRFGIPARFYFSAPLRSHPAATFLDGLISGALTGWDFEPALQTLRAHPGWGRSADFDRFDFAVREAMPGRGADALLALCESEWLRTEIAGCLKTGAWANERHTPAEWCGRFESMAAALYRPGILDAPRDHAAIAVERTHVAALQSWLAAVESVTPFWAEAKDPVALEQFWRVAAAAVESAAFQTPDERGQVVHVMNAYEARQWDLDVLFVCGAVDRDYPKRHPQNLLFPDDEIDALHKAGIPLQKAAEQEAREDALFDSLLKRATNHLIVTCPLRDASGKSANRSRFIGRIDTPQYAESIPCAPVMAEPDYPGRAGTIYAPDLLARLTDLHKSISMTALEDLAQCRFKFFGAKTLALKDAPERPAERLQARVLGSILHQAMDRWLRDRDRDFVEVFGNTFDEACRIDRIPAGYKLEVKRYEFRRIAENIRASERWQPESTETEVEVHLDFPGGVTVKGRIDRIDRFAGNECIVIDYKSSKVESVKKLLDSSTRLQGPLYTLAVRERLNLNPVAMMYWSVRDDETYGWGHVPGAADIELREMPANWATDARARTVQRLTGFLAGAVSIHPEEKELCKWCDFIGACRIEQPALIAIEGAA